MALKSCKECGKPVFVAHTKLGDRIACDPSIHALVITGSDGQYMTKDGYVPHWVTCSHRKEFKSDASGNS